MWQKSVLWPYLKIWDWDWIFGRAVKTISSLGVRSPCIRPWFHDRATTAPLPQCLLFCKIQARPNLGALAIRGGPAGHLLVAYKGGIQRQLKRHCHLYLHWYEITLIYLQYVGLNIHKNKIILPFIWCKFSHTWDLLSFHFFCYSFTSKWQNFDLMLWFDKV